MAEHTEFFLPFGNTVILVFSYKTRCQNSDLNAAYDGIKYIHVGGV